MSFARLMPIAIRKDFPIFAEDSPIAYLDSAASSQTARCVIEAMDGYYQSYRSNIHRGIYRISEEATAAYEEARQKGCAICQCASFEPNRIYAKRDRVNQSCRV